MKFVDVVVRQGHLGPGVPAYHRAEQKRDDALRFVREEAIPWAVVVDDIDGRVHAQYGLLPDPTYLIGTDGSHGACRRAPKTWRRRLRGPR